LGGALLLTLAIQVASRATVWKRVNGTDGGVLRIASYITG
jgi:hypothetical protein